MILRVEYSFLGTKIARGARVICPGVNGSVAGDLCADPIVNAAAMYILWDCEELPCVQGSQVSYVGPSILYLPQSSLPG